MPAPLPDAVTHAVELLAPLGPVRVKRMFGGYGFYVDELFMALMLSQQLYLKADAETVPRFEAEGCRPFQYEGAGRTVSVSYWTAPDEALESPPAMAAWARLALEAALRARAPKSARKRGAVARPGAQESS